MKRREFIKLSALASPAIYLNNVFPAFSETFKLPPEAGSMTYEISFTSSEWKEKLTSFQYSVLREQATEPAFTSPLNEEFQEGVYHCAGCELPLYSSETKFSSSSGWPSFFDNIFDSVRTREDRSWFMTRTEVHCRRCGGHLGHIFKDGPKPTGLRHCINGIALNFVPASA